MGECEERWNAVNIYAHPCSHTFSLPIDDTFEKPSVNSPFTYRSFISLRYTHSLFCISSRLSLLFSLLSLSFPFLLQCPLLPPHLVRSVAVISNLPSHPQPVHRVGKQVHASWIQPGNRRSARTTSRSRRRNSRPNDLPPRKPNETSRHKPERDNSNLEMEQYTVSGNIQRANEKAGDTIEIVLCRFENWFLFTYF